MQHNLKTHQRLLQSATINLRNIYRTYEGKEKITERIGVQNNCSMTETIPKNTIDISEISASLKESSVALVFNYIFKINN